MTEHRATSGLPLLLFAAALFAAGGVWLLRNTVVQDLNHPAYSTLNAAPEGTRVLYEALSSASLDARRLYAAGELPPDATLFRIGQPLSQGALQRVMADPDEAAFVIGGGRLVCAFAGWKPDRRLPSDTNSCDTGTCSAAATNRPAAAARSVTGSLTLVAVTNLSDQARGRAGDGRVPWYSVATFASAPGAPHRWRTLYALDGHPVMVESRVGRGSLVLATDCYFLSNEALVNDRRPALLAGLVGGSRTILFDETIHGLRETHNTTWLLHRYRLHLLVAVLGLLFLLTLWQHACPLLPRAQESRADSPLRGFRMEDGLVSLLRGHLPAARLPRQLFETWQQTAPHLDEAARADLLRLLDHADAVHAPPEETCRSLHRLAQRKRPALKAASSKHLEGERPREPHPIATAPTSSTTHTGD